MAKKRIRVMLSLDKDLAKLIESTQGFGDKSAEKCTNIIRAWFAEKSVISTNLKRKLEQQ